MPDITEVKETQAAPDDEEARLASETPRPSSPPSRKKPAGQGRKKLIKRLIALGVAAAVLGGGGFALYRFLNSNDEELGEIYSVPASIGTIQSTVSGEGSAKAKENAAITLTQKGVVQEVFVTSGQTVMAGEPLYTIFSQEAEDEVERKREALSEAQKNVTKTERDMPNVQEEIRDLKDQLAELNDALARQNRALSKLNEEMAELNNSRADLTVRAPHDGKILKYETFTVGRDAAAGSPVCTVANDQTMKLPLYFSYAYENSIYIGQTAQVSIPSLMKVQEGRVEEIRKVNFVTPEGGTFFEVVVSLTNPGALTKDMTATATMTNTDGSDIYPYAEGKLDYAQTWDLELKQGGPVLAVDMREHAVVKAGQALLVVGDEQLADKIEAKREEIETQQKSIRDQQKSIEVKQKEIADKEKWGPSDARELLEEARKKVEEAQKDLEDAQKKLEDFNAVAPIDGTVTSCSIEPGQEVDANTTVITIANTVTMLVTISVDDRNISFIKPGNFVDLTDWNDNMYQGQVTSIDMSKLESEMGMTRYPVTLTVDNYDGSLTEGTTLRYSFVTSQSDDCVQVPTACIQYFSDMDGNRCAVVFVQREERPDDVPELDFPTFEPGQKRTFPTEEEGYYPVIVETGLADTQNVEIISGVEEMDTVFVNYTVTDSAWG